MFGRKKKVWRAGVLVAFIAGISISPASWGQSAGVFFYEHIEPIIHKNCMPCHQPGQAGPFSLITYDDVSRKGEFIAKVTKSRYMPPWKADLNFQQYRNARSLTDSEIALIQEWVAAGMPKGKAPKKTKNTLPRNTALITPDLSLKVAEPYQILTTGIDDFRFFNVPTQLKRDQYLRKIEFIPGNKRLVHHSRLMTDTTHKVRDIHGLSANDPQVNQFEKYPPVDKFLYGWVPGNFAIEFPKGTGKKLYKDSDIIVNIHYSPNRRENQQDQSTVNFYFTEEDSLREVHSMAIAEQNITNGPFVIPAEETKIFYSKFGPLPIDISAVAVLPHMHFLGKTFRAFAITQEGDAIFLVKIDDWDFNWQDTYQFSKLLKIPRGSTIFVEATFDNTVANPANPTRPPKTVTYGW
ncbi:MAG TPA: cytochrome c, partial [Chryseolinea sp.]|nr:cytochrome c [Chryseolinea sp.]